jgi:hypothetical protein
VKIKKGDIVRVTKAYESTTPDADPEAYPNLVDGEADQDASSDRALRGPSPARGGR